MQISFCSRSALDKTKGIFSPCNSICLTPFFSPFSFTSQAQLNSIRRQCRPSELPLYSAPLWQYLHTKEPQGHEQKHSSSIQSFIWLCTGWCQNLPMLVLQDSEARPFQMSRSAKFYSNICTDCGDLSNIPEINSALEGDWRRRRASEKGDEVAQGELRGRKRERDA